MNFLILAHTLQSTTEIQLQNWQIYGYLYFKTKMGVAGVIFEPHPPNFENLYNF